MSRTKAVIRGESRVSDYVSIGVMTNIISIEKVRETLEESKKETQRCRKLPLELMVYFVILLNFYPRVSIEEVQRCLLEGLSWINVEFKNKLLAGKAAISQARTRLGSLPLKKLFEKICVPIATAETKGAWYKKWRLMAIDGSTLDLPDEKANSEYFGKAPSRRGESAFPKLRFASLVEIGSHVPVAASPGKYATSELILAEELLPKMSPDMLCLMDRGFFGFRFYEKALKTGADWIFRIKKNLILTHFKNLPDGSFLSKVYKSVQDRKKDCNGVTVRIIEYCLKGVAKAERKYILLTNVLDYQEAPAKELAAIYHERWEIETSYDEMKTHLKTMGGSLRSKTPELAIQEFYGWMLSYFVIRSVMHQSALKVDLDVDKLSFVHAVRVIHRKITAMRFSPKEARYEYSQGSDCR